MLSTGPGDGTTSTGVARVASDELKKPHAAAKYDNAKMFAEYSLSKHDWFKHPERIPPDAILRLVPLSETKFA